MKKALVVGGGSGIGLSVVKKLLNRGYDFVYIVGKDAIKEKDLDKNDLQLFKEKTSFTLLNLTQDNYSVFDEINDIDTLFISAGFGRVAPFEELTETEITNLIKCNELSVIQIIKKYYDKLSSNQDFYCGIMVSIAGRIASPLFSVYGASKMGLRGFIENINVELASQGYSNRILDVSPGSLKGTSFNGGDNDLSQLEMITDTIIDKMFNKELLYIPDYDKTYKNVIERYDESYMEFGQESYQYKIEGGRLNHHPQVTIGYLSGTFDLFHIGHLNLLRRAKAQCDYLIVGVHESGAWKGKETFIPFEERVQIVASCQYVDKAIMSYPEDSDAWDEFHYNKLFVGDDYKGSERFLKYEEYFKERGVEIVYFPYTKGTSSTQLRQKLSSNK